MVCFWKDESEEKSFWLEFVLLLFSENWFCSFVWSDSSNSGSPMLLASDHIETDIFIGLFSSLFKVKGIEVPRISMLLGDLECDRLVLLIFRFLQ